MRGELNHCAAPDLRTALSDVTQVTAGDVHIDLAGVPHLSLDIARVLATTAIELSTDQRQLVVHQLAPHLVDMIRLLGWEQTPGLQVHEKSWRLR
ncbi:anti-anti-sigma regulatory factor [Kutzneria viridogrisea]|uniref:Anti-anti-sigma regulatory factor n=1 Tax=Kutzneria viridogrisea TaxID=47990 RepID=A0ABR6BSZ2_9PSEU|nr:STAS domain-containing protein [Kutzneria albida]MBA8930016.1 anti-anti-sigma regulatory factor [Kutzneria viridogrisea]